MTAVTIDRETAQQAHDALEEFAQKERGDPDGMHPFTDALVTLRLAMAEADLNERNEP